MIDNFTPTFLKATGFDSSSGATYFMRSDYFADQATAQAVATEYGTGQIRQTPMLGPGPFGIDILMYEFKMEDGRWVNAGLIADYYVRTHPGDAADHDICAALGIPPKPKTVIPPPVIRPLPVNTFVGPRDQFGVYSGQGDTNPAGKIIDNPFLSGDEKLLKVIGKFMGDRHYWIDASPGSQLN